VFTYTVINNNIIKKTKKIFISFFTITLLLNLSIHPITQGQTIRNKNQEIHIDPSLYLTQNHLPLLKKAKEHCLNQTITTILTKIIQELQQKESINANELQLLIKETAIKPIWISFLKPVFGDTSGSFFCFPGFLIASLFGEDWSDMDKIVFPYIGPSIFLIGKGDIHIFRFLNDVDGTLFACIGFFGVITSYSYEHYGGFHFIGIPLLTITITPP